MSTEITTLRVWVGEPHHGLASHVAVRLVDANGVPVIAAGATLPEALRRLATHIEEQKALGPLEQEPRRAAIAALESARREVWRLANLCRDTAHAFKSASIDVDQLSTVLRELFFESRPRDEVLKELQRTTERLQADIDHDKAEGYEDEDGRAR